MAIESLHESYRRAADHWVDCATCTGAGGEQGDLCDLCVTGRELLVLCEQAEKRWLIESASAYGA